MTGPSFDDVLARDVAEYVGDPVAADEHIARVSESIQRTAKTNADCALFELVRVIEAGGMTKAQLIELIIWDPEVCEAFERGAMGVQL